MRKTSRARVSRRAVVAEQSTTREEDEEGEGEENEKVAVVVVAVVVVEVVVAVVEVELTGGDGDESGHSERVGSDVVDASEDPATSMSSIAPVPFPLLPPASVNTFPLASCCARGFHCGRTRDTPSPYLSNSSSNPCNGNAKKNCQSQHNLWIISAWISCECGGGGGAVGAGMWELRVMMAHISLAAVFPEIKKM
jgi:hypothetical protein